MYNKTSVGLRMDPCWKFDKSSSNNMNLKYNFSFKAIIWLLKNLKILVSLESHGRVEYCNGNYFGKKEELKLRKRRWIFLTFFVKLLRIANLISKKKYFLDHKNAGFILIYTRVATLSGISGIGSIKKKICKYEKKAECKIKA